MGLRAGNRHLIFELARKQAPLIPNESEEQALLISVYGQIKAVVNPSTLLRVDAEYSRSINSSASSLLMLSSSSSSNPSGCSVLKTSQSKELSPRAVQALMRLQVIQTLKSLQTRRARRDERLTIHQNSSNLMIL